MLLTSNLLDHASYGLMDPANIGVRLVNGYALQTNFVIIQIVIVSNEAERRDFIKEIGEEALPEEYGGRSNLIALQDVTLNPLED